MLIDTDEQLTAAIQALIDAWCQRRGLDPLRYVLAAWPPAGNLVSEWWQVRDAFKHVHMNLADTLTADELVHVRAVVRYLDNAFNLLS